MSRPLRSTWALVALLAVPALGACRGQTSTEPPIVVFRGMHEMPRYDVQEAAPYFDDGRAMRPPVTGTLPIEAELDLEVAEGLDATGAYVATIPQAAIDHWAAGGESGMSAMIERGQQRYGIYCAPCHGIAGDGQGMVSQRATTLGVAFAAANLDVVALRRAANILDREASLVFVGPEGELPDEIPTLRKVALPGAGPDRAPYAPPPPLLSPVETPPEPVVELNLPHPPVQIIPQPPGAPSPRVGWLRFGRIVLAGTPLAVAVAWVLSVPTYPPLPLGPMLVVFVAASLANAVLHWPPRDAIAARRRLPLLLLLAAPALVSFAAGPFGLLPQDITAPQTLMAKQFQAACMIASAVLPLGLLYVLRGARRLTWDVAGLGALATFLSASVAVITLTPGV